MRRLSNSIVTEIRHLLSSGHSTRQIAQKLNLSHTTIIRHADDKDRRDYEKKAAGRPRKLSERETRWLVRNFELGIFKTTTDAIDQFWRETGISVCKTTIARILHRCGIKSYAMPKKPRLTKNHKLRRLQFTRLMKRFPEEAWKVVVFTDESRISVFGPDGNKRSWRRSSKILLDRHVIQTVKFGGKSVMVWGAITYDGVGELKFIDMKMDSNVYIDILRSGYFSTLEMHGFDVDSSILQQDNDPKHLSKETKMWLLEQRIKVLNWPSCSPDLNIIENVWYYLKARVHRVTDKPRTIDDLKVLIKQEWQNIPLSYIRNLYDSIQRRLDEVIRSKGGYTSY